MEINLNENFEVQSLSKYRCVELPQNLKKGYYGGTMSFFESELVRDELEELHDLQNEIYGNLFDYPKMTKKEKLYHIELLEQLLEKQQILFTRLNLSDDPEAKEMRDRILDSATLMGLPLGQDMSVIFSNMKSLIEMMKFQVDRVDS